MKHSSLNHWRGISCAVAFLAIVSLPGYALNAAETGSPTQIVNTSNGPVRGRVDNRGLNVFKGVRYGAPPVGDLRFKPPRKPAPWTEVADASKNGARAIQAAGGTGLAELLDDFLEYDLCQRRVPPTCVSSRS